MFAQENQIMLVRIFIVRLNFSLTVANAFILILGLFYKKIFHLAKECSTPITVCSKMVFTVSHNEALINVYSA